MAIAAPEPSARWLDRLSELQTSSSPIRMPRLLDKLTLPAKYCAQWSSDTCTAESDGYACLDLALPPEEEKLVGAQQLQHIISACLGKDRSDTYVPVVSIDFSGCKVEHAALWKLAAESMSLGSHCMLRHLKLSRCSLTEEAFGELAYLQPATEQLQSLDMSHNPLLRLKSSKQLLEVQLLFEDAPLRLLSLHHTGLTNEDTCLLADQLAANPEQNATQAYLACLKIGPPMHSASTPTQQQQGSEAVPFVLETVQKLNQLISSLQELQVLEIWGLNAEQQSSLSDAWAEVKGRPGHVAVSADVFRICSNASHAHAQHPVEQWPMECKLPTKAPPAPTPSPVRAPRPDPPIFGEGSEQAINGHQAGSSPTAAGQAAADGDDDFQMLPPRQAGSAEHAHLSRPPAIASAHANQSRQRAHAPMPGGSRPRQQSGHAQQHRRFWRPADDTGEPAVSRLYASLGLGYDAPNAVEDDEFAMDARRKRPAGHARLIPHTSAERDAHNSRPPSGHRKRSHASHVRQRAVAPEHGGGREYDIEAEFMDELGPLPKARPAEDNAGTRAAKRPKQRRKQTSRPRSSLEAGATEEEQMYDDPQAMDWQGSPRPEMLNSPRHNSPDRDQRLLEGSRSPIAIHSSPGSESASQESGRQSPHRPTDQPAGVESDDNFEVSDDADEQQLRRGRWDEEDGSAGSSSGAEAVKLPAVRPANMSKREWELLQEARELEQGAFAFDKNRSKYQPKGHFDAAVGGRRRQQRAAAGSALEQLRRRRMQQNASSGGEAESSGTGQQSHAVQSDRQGLQPTDVPAAKTSRHRQRARFVDDQAAGGQSCPSAASHSSLSDSPQPGTGAKQKGLHAAQHADAAVSEAVDSMDVSSSSSGSDRPLLAKRRRSQSLQHTSQPSGSDNDMTPAVGDQPPEQGASHNNSKRPASAAAKLAKKRARDKQRPRNSGSVGQVHTPSPAVVPMAAGTIHGGTILPVASSSNHGGQELAGSAVSPDGEHAQPAVGPPLEEAEEQQELPAVFEVPSQMPRELQSWAWDKRADQHPPNLQKIYPAQAKRVRKAPDRYTVDDAPQMHKSHSEEQRKLAHHLDAALPPRSHSGKNRKSGKSIPGTLATLPQAARVSSSDDDDMPLAMLPPSLSAAKQTAAARKKTPSSLASQPSPNALAQAVSPSASNAIATDTAKTGLIDSEAVNIGAADTGDIVRVAINSEAIGTTAIDTNFVDTRAVDSEAIDTAAIDSGAVDSEAIDTEALSTGAIGIEAVRQPSAAEGDTRMASVSQRPVSTAEPASAGEGRMASGPEHANMLKGPAVSANKHTPKATMVPKDAKPCFRSVSDVLRPTHERQFTPSGADAASFGMHQQATPTDEQDPASGSETAPTEQPRLVSGYHQRPAASKAEELISDSESEGGQGAVAPAVNPATTTNSMPCTDPALQLRIQPTGNADHPTANAVVAAAAAEHADHSTAAAAEGESLSTTIRPATAATKEQSMSMVMEQDSPSLVQRASAEMSHGSRQSTAVLPMRRQTPTRSADMAEAIVPAVPYPALSTEQQGSAQLPATEAGLHRPTDGPNAMPGRAETPFYDSSASLQQAEAEAARLALLMVPTQSRQANPVSSHDNVPAASWAHPVSNEDNVPAASPAQAVSNADNVPAASPAQPVSNHDKVPASSLAQPGLMQPQQESAPLASPSSSNATAEPAVDSVGTAQHKQQPSGRPRLALRNRSGELQQLATQVANRQHGTVSDLQPSGVISSSEQHANAASTSVMPAASAVGEAGVVADITIPDSEEQDA